MFYRLVHHFTYFIMFIELLYCMDDVVITRQENRLCYIYVTIVSDTNTSKLCYILLPLF
jgi:hypothetical protein